MVSKNWNQTFVKKFVQGNFKVDRIECIVLVVKNNLRILYF